ncbi:hypothetical protein C8Z91_34760 [Paenibacillus elgii]|uniref:Nucleotidyl transferase domain-containing protein n=1 Tax=Paenibacillus elgii TaxID=189691 RepID=A0A2T6FRU9_9BACL|nr:sugar phosphate nucleotidyltransferase [Paenibacillus elgii]PUA34629.1 hypothetical protein C8Z91_34760 [Paenibacillus elgii]
MKIVLLSGGAGKRLWPLSNKNTPKQFLKLLEDDGVNVSMLQRLWRQLSKGGLIEDVFITTNVSQLMTLKDQIGENVPIIIEPSQRDTFPAIALSASYFTPCWKSVYMKLL